MATDESKTAWQRTISQTTTRSTADPSTPNIDFKEQFPEAWTNATSGNKFSRYGFRRFRTAHLLNLRFLEAEIHELDHVIYQAGIRSCDIPSQDPLGLAEAKLDTALTDEQVAITQPLILRLRSLLKEYDEAVIALNQLLTLETFSLADNPAQSYSRSDLNTLEIYKTRLVRIDLPAVNVRDPLQIAARRIFRLLWYFVFWKQQTLDLGLAPTYQNTARVAELAVRFAVALIAGGFLVGPLALLSYQSSKEAHLITVSVCILVFAFIVSMASKASNEGTMAATAAYAAVLAVFVSANP